MVTLNRKRHDAVFRAIADPTRREILGMLRGRSYSVGAIAAKFRTSRPAISKHLRTLRAVGLVATTQRGTARICALNAEPLRAVSDWISDYETYWGKALHSLKRYVEDER
ncbi:MAG TPA: metalloregulator ArsR/SmtB family transcription factor [Xanthobacteraceae bacterium]|jgi:DNA-binding transcriptional ArsR family regulator